MPRADLLAFTVFPREIWRQIWSNNPNERLNREIRRRTDVVGIFLPTGTPSSAWSAPSWPGGTSRLGAPPAWGEEHDKWAERRRYLGLDILTRSLAVLTATNPEEANHLAIASALSA